MQLKKLTDDHYVVVTDEPIKEGDWYIRLDTNNIFSLLSGSNSSIIQKYCKKITHSTQPLEEIKYIEQPNVPCYCSINKLDLSYVKKLLGEIDVENLSKEATDKKGYNNEDGGEYQEGWEDGYNQCLEDNKDKRFSEDDMLIIRNKLVDILPVGDVSSWDMIQAISKYTKWFDKYVESITQPKDTWEVEFDENNNLKLK